MKLLYVSQIMDRHSTKVGAVCYEVTKVVNSLNPNIRSRLVPDELKTYCDSDEWKVTIT